MTTETNETVLTSRFSRIRKPLLGMSAVLLVLAGVGVWITANDAKFSEASKQPDAIQGYVDQAAKFAEQSTGQAVTQALVYSGSRASLLAAADAGSVPEEAGRVDALLIEFDGPFETFHHPQLSDSKPEGAEVLVFILDAQTGEMLDGGGSLVPLELASKLGDPLKYSVD